MQRTVCGATLSVCVAMAVCVIAAGCAGEEDTSPPVATIDVGLSRQRVALGSPVAMTYKVRVANDALPLGDRRVFVHFVDADEELMWTDDHQPPTPTTAWKPGATVEWSRTVFAPIYPYVGPAKIVIGLYDTTTNERLKLSQADRGDRSYQVAEFELLPQTDNIFLIFKDGWHPAEVAPDNPAIEWQWMRKDGIIAFRNPRRASTLYLQLDNPSRAASGAEKVEIYIGDQLIATLPVTAEESPVHKIPISAAQLGSGDMVEIRLIADRTFVPALEPGVKSNDTRELGVRVFHAFVEPK